jgi:hypothetical protein
VRRSIEGATQGNRCSGNHRNASVPNGSSPGFSCTCYASTAKSYPHAKMTCVFVYHIVGRHIIWRYRFYFSAFCCAFSPSTYAILWPDLFSGSSDTGFHSGRFEPAFRRGMEARRSRPRHLRASAVFIAPKPALLNTNRPLR